MDQDDDDGILVNELSKSQFSLTSGNPQWLQVRYFDVLGWYYDAFLSPPPSGPPPRFPASIYLPGIRFTSRVHFFV